tara:strand:+ start:60 stop:344 length:285 start_codon:yes stop_codon:yes gene_type:complete
MFSTTMKYLKRRKQNKRKDRDMSDLRWEVYAEHMQEQIFDEIYNEMPKLYQGRDFDEVVENVMKYVNTTYNDWERFFTPEQVEELVQQYTASLT